MNPKQYTVRLDIYEGEIASNNQIVGLTEKLEANFQNGQWIVTSDLSPFTSKAESLKGALINYMPIRATGEQ